jgi:hypothetical protein
LPISFANLRNRQASTDFSREQIGDLSVARDRFRLARLRIAPQRVSAPFSFQVAAMQAEMAQEGFALH